MVSVKVMDRHFSNGTVPFEISVIKWLELKITGNVHVFNAKKDGWEAELPLYIAKCHNCKQHYLDYPHGHKELLLCPECDLGEQPSSVSKSMEKAHRKIPRGDAA